MPVIEAPRYWDYTGVTLGEPFVPFAAQAEILNTIKIPWIGRNKRTRVPYPRIFTLRCGRRFSKTTIGNQLLWRGLMAPNDWKGPPEVRVTADTEEHGMKIWRPFINQIEQTDLRGFVKDHSKEFNRVELLSGAIAQLYSAHNPNALSGDGVTTWLVDEAQFVSGEAVDNLSPSTSDRSGVIIYLGVAQGEGPFKRLSYMGMDKSVPGILDLRYPTSANPYIDPWEIEFARTVTYADRENVFKQLYEAEWVGELGKIFVGVGECVVKDPVLVHSRGFHYTTPPSRGNVYYGGLDIGRLQDWTVYTVWDRTGKLIAWDRFQQTSWKVLFERIARMSAAYGHPLTTVDSTGIGDPAFEALMDKGMNVVEYKIVSNQAKHQLIDEFALRIVSNEVRFPYIRQFQNELEKMEAKSAGQNSMVVRYEAPAGEHDDFVISAALAFQEIPKVTHAKIRPDPVMRGPEDDILPGDAFLDPMTQHSAYEYI